MRKPYALVLVLVALATAFWWGRHTATTVEATVVSTLDADSAATPAPASEPFAPRVTRPISVVEPGSASANGMVAASAASLSGTSTAPASAVESRLMTGIALNQRAIDLVASKDFDRLLAATHREADAESLKTTAAFRELVQSGLEDADGKPSLRDIACTRRLCLASIQGPAGGRFDWDTLLNAASGTDLRLGALIPQQVQLPDGRVETRVVFTFGLPGAITGGPSAPPAR